MGSLLVDELFRLLSISIEVLLQGGGVMRLGCRRGEVESLVELIDEDQFEDVGRIDLIELARGNRGGLDLPAPDKQGTFGVEIRSEKRDLLCSEVVFGLFYSLHDINDVGQALQSSHTASSRTSLPPPGAWSMSLQRPGRLGINKKRKRFYE